MEDLGLSIGQGLKVVVELGWCLHFSSTSLAWMCSWPHLCNLCASPSWYRAVMTRLMNLWNLCWSRSILNVMSYCAFIILCCWKTYFGNCFVICSVQCALIVTVKILHGYTNCIYITFIASYIASFAFLLNQQFCLSVQKFEVKLLNVEVTLCTHCIATLHISGDLTA